MKFIFGFPHDLTFEKASPVEKAGYCFLTALQMIASVLGFVLILTL